MDFNEQEKALIGAIETKTNEMLNTKSDAVKAELNKEIEALKSQIENKELKDEVVRVATELKALKEDGKKEEKPNLVNEIKANKDALVSIAKGMNNEVTLKANVTRASIASNAHAVDLPEIGQLATRRLVAYDIFPKISVPQGNHNGTIRYVDWDEATKVRAAAMRAEGNAFPESTAAWATYTLPLQKIGDTLPVTEEFFEDEQLAASELEMFLMTNVAVVRDTQLVTGSGTAPNLAGIYTSAPTYTAAASSISDASIYDLIVKMKQDITATGGSKYTPDFAMMNINDINKMKLKKDANDNYVLPPFADRAGNVVDGIVVVESNAITANTLVLGDRRFARIYEMGGVSVSKGLVNAQFSSDLITLKVRQRLALLVREADKTGFLKCTSISAALTTLAL